MPILEEILILKMMSGWEKVIAVRILTNFVSNTGAKIDCLELDDPFTDPLKVKKSRGFT